MDFVLIILTLVLGLLIGCLGIIGIKEKQKGTGAAFVLATTFILVGISNLILYKSTDWKYVKTEYIVEIAESTYIHQFDNQYVYGVKDANKDTEELDIIHTDTEITVETEYLEEAEAPYMQKWTRWQDYKEYTKYVFYIPKTE